MKSPSSDNNRLAMIIFLIVLTYAVLYTVSFPNSLLSKLQFTTYRKLHQYKLVYFSQF